MVFNPTRGPARSELDHETATALATAGVLIHDDRRLRSAFFDGRFLTATDLTREQAYFLQRQADLCRAGGVGVVSGLRVSAPQKGDAVGTLRIGRGHGVTPSGELVVVPHDLTQVRLDDIPEIEHLNAAFGLSRIPREPARSRNGLFVVALRPVEYSANPIAAYPTALGGARTAHDGDIVEAVAVTLIPYPDQAAASTLSLRRSRAAHEVFVRGVVGATPVDALPIAMIALDHGVLAWVDEFLVRREVGSEQTDFLGFGYAPQALREAHVLQYQRHLAQVLREQSTSGARFAASDHFFALPPVGPLPLAAIDPASFTEFFFPAEVDVELSVIPDDELAALIQESLFLPPIDLTLPGEQLATTSVVVLVPVPRQKMEQVLSFLFPTQRVTGLKLRAAAPGLTARRLPGAALQALSAKWAAPVAQSVGAGLADAAWGKVVALAGARAGHLWYARRKNFPYKPSLIGERAPRIDAKESPGLVAALGKAQLVDEFSSLGARATVQAIVQAHALLLALLAEVPAPHNVTLTAGAAGELLRLDAVDADAVAALKARYAYGDRGVGLTKLLAAEPLLEKIELPEVARSFVVVELDAIGRLLADADRKVAAQLLLAASTQRRGLAAGVDDVKQKFKLKL